MSVSIRAVLFDCDGVLQRPSNDWTGVIGTLTGLVGAELDTFLEEVSAVEQPVLDGSEPYARPLGDVVRRWGLAVRVEELLRAWQHLDVDAGMLEAADELGERGIRCALGTNQHRERGAYMRRELGYDKIFDPMIISSEIGVAKPDPAFFREAVRQIGLPAREILFVDDVQANVEGALEVGLVAEHFAKDAGRTELDRILARHGLAEAVAA